ncbi:hypothetical protein PCA20602_01635 [Pandoraea capi]|uniref:Uncharacterized protein n=1 Tax=Pandoraea capi TaxID=2508286 RepID=A0ABY6VUW1_9BURK|nr:hypothetical protein PCA20602_01635 [Pandoraea capi]
MTKAVTSVPIVRLDNRSEGPWAMRRVAPG